MDPRIKNINMTLQESLILINTAHFKTIGHWQCLLPSLRAAVAGDGLFLWNINAKGSPVPDQWAESCRQTAPLSTLVGDPGFRHRFPCQRAREPLPWERKSICKEYNIVVTTLFSSAASIISWRYSEATRAWCKDKRVTLNSSLKLSNSFVLYQFSRSPLVSL